MERFPTEVQTLIFEFDNTERERFDKVVHQIRFIPVLQNILEWSCRCYVGIVGLEWYSPLFRLYKENTFLKKPRFVEEVRETCWGNYFHDVRRDRFQKV